MNAVSELEQGRNAYERRAWTAAYDSLSAADEAEPLSASDLELLAVAAYMLGHVPEYLGALERAHNSYLVDEEILPAARAAVYLGMNLAMLGDLAQAGGWFARSERLVERAGTDCAERGYLLLPAAVRGEAVGDHTGAHDAAADAVAIAERFDDRDLFALAAHVQGHSLINLGRVDDGFKLLDEAMLGAIGGELSPVVTGIVYCGAIAGCEEAFDVRRAHEWTTALARWWEGQPDMVAFTGRCLAHRAEILQLRGAWPEALEEAKRAHERCRRSMNRLAAGQAAYQQAEVLRRQGDLAGAEAAYREANACGREPQPGLGLLRLAQGDVETAGAAVRRSLAETTSPLRRSRLLPAYTEIAIAAGDLDEARRSADELAAIASDYPTAMLRAIAAHVRGAAELATGDASSSLVTLRGALLIWQELEAPYEAARARVLLAAACRGLGDEDTASLELDAARRVFEDVGAQPDVDRVDAMARRSDAGETYGLTARELEVLRLVAAGKTNREIAATLVVSEHTVARHVQNILGKLRVSSRTAATAFAFEHELV